MGQQESLPQKIPHREEFPSAPSWVQGGFYIWVGAAFTKPSSVVSLVLQNSSINHQPSPQQVWHFTPPGQETRLHVSHEVRHRNKTPKSSTHPPATGTWGLLPPSLSLSVYSHSATFPVQSKQPPFTSPTKDDTAAGTGPLSKQPMPRCGLILAGERHHYLTLLKLDHCL
ncbi:unnamed protein product [Lepidochelys kempii]